MAVDNIDAPLAGLQRRTFVHRIALELTSGALDQADASAYGTAIVTYFGVTPDQNFVDGKEISPKTIREATQAISQGNLITKNVIEGVMFRAYYEALKRPETHAATPGSKEVDQFTSPTR